MGPNYFCWQPICYMAYGINAFAWHVKPHTYSDVQHVIDKIMKHKETIERYRFVAFQMAHNIFQLTFFLAKIVFFFWLMTLSYTKHQNYNMMKAQKQILSGPRMSLGILRNYDGNRNAQNAIGLGSETTTLHLYHAFC